MINKRNAKRKCKDDISKIENYEQAINDKENIWICHHRLELTLDGEFAHTGEELDRMGMYYKRPYFELIFIPQKLHRKLHGVNKLNKPNKNSDFGKKYFEHYGYSKKENENQYRKEQMWYYYHNHKCRWEK